MKLIISYLFSVAVRLLLKAMNKPDPGQKKSKYPNAESRIKYKTDIIVRPKLKELFTPLYNTTPVEKYSWRPSSDKKSEPNYYFKIAEHHKNQISFGKNKSEADWKNSDESQNHYHQSSSKSQFEYINNNLCIKSCIGNREVLRFQMKKVSFRNYTPKILNQEINMGMWI